MSAITLLGGEKSSRPGVGDGDEGGFGDRNPPGEEQLARRLPAFTAESEKESSGDGDSYPVVALSVMRIRSREKSLAIPVGRQKSPRVPPRPPKEERKCSTAP